MNLLLHKTGPIGAEITIPGSKSFSHRALLAAVLSPGTTLLHQVSDSDDTQTLIAALIQLGAGIRQSDNVLQVQGWGNQLPKVSARLDVGPAGTPARFLTALAGMLPHSEIEIHGNERMNTRPIGPLVEALRQLNIQIAYLGQAGSTPIRITTGNEITHSRVTLEATASSQFISGLMLTAPVLKHGLTIELKGTRASASYLAMTETVIRDFGGTVKQGPSSITVAPGYGGNPNYAIEADASGAINFFGLAACAGGEIAVTNLNANSQQGDMQALDILEAMGCQRFESGSGVGLRSSGLLRGVTAVLANLPDAALALGVTAACARGTSRFSGLATLNTKESNRLDVLGDELQQLGCSTVTTPDNITIEPGPPSSKKLRFATYDDHRVAMAFAIGCTRRDVIIVDAEVVSKSFPGFWGVLKQCGVELEET